MDLFHLIKWLSGLMTPYLQTLHRFPWVTTVATLTFRTNTHTHILVLDIHPREAMSWNSDALESANQTLSVLHLALNLHSRGSQLPFSRSYSLSVFTLCTLSPFPLPPLSTLFWSSECISPGCNRSTPRILHHSRPRWKSKFSYFETALLTHFCFSCVEYQGQ